MDWNEGDAEPILTTNCELPFLFVIPNLIRDLTGWTHSKGMGKIKRAREKFPLDPQALRSLNTYHPYHPYHHRLALVGKPVSSQASQPPEPLW